MALACLTAVFATPAHAATGDSTVSDQNAFGHLNSIGVDQPAPDGTKPITADALPREDALDFEANLAVTDILTADIDRAINTVTWDSKSDRLQFYA